MPLLLLEHIRIHRINVLLLPKHVNSHVKLLRPEEKAYQTNLIIHQMIYFLAKVYAQQDPTSARASSSHMHSSIHPPQSPH